MSLLACRQYVLPVLRVLHRFPDGLSAADLAESVATETSLSAADRALTIQDGTPCYAVRIRTARYWLSKQEHVEEAGNQRWKITKKGIEYAKAGYEPRSLRSITLRPSGETGVAVLQPLPIEESGESPFERIDAALKEIRDAFAQDLHDKLRRMPARRLEKTVIDLLGAMMPSPVRPRHTGGAGDRGVDGVITLDRLGLDCICVQVKNGAKPVQPEAIRDFCGALDIARSRKGVFVTTGKFTRRARDDAYRLTTAISLIDGDELVLLMMDYGIGVSRAESRVIPKIDQDYFNTDYKD